jgi:hypothetical protein
MITFIIISVAVLISSAATQPTETARYLRPAGDGFETECEITRKQTKTGAVIDSTTLRGKTRMTVRATYDADDALNAAGATLVSGEQKSSVAVTVAGGKAKVMPDKAAAKEFDVPKGGIVTSAPDWTDAWMLCRRFDRAMKGKQEFAGLWIHPTEASQRLTFAIEKQGTDVIEHAGKKQTLDRCTIWLRGGSRYAVWCDDGGQMIKLVPLPYKDGATNWLVRAGFEKSTAHLRP